MFWFGDATKEEETAMSKRSIVVLAALFAILLSLEVASAQGVYDKIGRPWEADIATLAVVIGNTSTDFSLIKTSRVNGMNTVMAPIGRERSDDLNWPGVNETRMISPQRERQTFIGQFTRLFFLSL